MQTQSLFKKNIKLFAALAALALAVVLLCQYLSNFFYVYWTAFSVQQQDYKADVVFVGPSHVFTDVIPQKLYDDQGIAACNVAAGSIGMNNIYWGARESIDTMHPKLLCVDLMALIDNEDSQNVNLIEELPLLSPNRWRAMSEAGATLQNWGDYVRFLFSHGQYESLSRSNFDSGRYVGSFALAMGYEQTDKWRELPVDEEPHVTEDTPFEPLSLPADSVADYRRLAQYAEQQGVEVLWYLSIDPREERQESYLNAVALLEADGRELLNCNLDSIKQAVGYDCTTDMQDSHHLNYTGAAKFTAWLGEYIAQHYSLPDRSGQKGYELWQRYPHLYEQQHAAHQLADCNDLDTYISLLHQLGSNYYVAVTGWGEWYLTDAQRTALTEDWGGGNLIPEDQIDFLLLHGEGQTLFSRTDSILRDAAPAQTLAANLDGRAFVLTDGERGVSLTLDRTEVLPARNGFALTVYSRIDHAIVDSICFPPGEPVVHYGDADAEY